MIGDLPEREVQWLSRFFSAPNCLQWQQIVSGNGPTHWLTQVTPWLTLLGSERTNRSLILPMFGPDGPLAWYGFASDEHAAATLAEEIRSLIGPSYSDFRGQRYLLSDVDEVERVVRSRYPYAFEFRPLSNSDASEIARLLLIYHGLLSRRPLTPDRTQRPFGKVRGDFDRALLAGNEPRARNFLIEMCESGRVNAEQRKCLEIRLFAGLGRHEDLAHNHSLISSVADLSLPPQTITDLVEALYETYIAASETEVNPQTVISLFKQHIANFYGPLFRERKGIRQPKVLRSFLLFELSQVEPNRTRCAAILSAYPESAEGGFLIKRWLESVPKETAEIQLGILDRARQAIADEDYAVAIDLSFQAIPNPWAYSSLLRCAIEIQSTEITSRVLEAMRQAPSTVHAALNTKARSRLEQLRASREAVEVRNVDTNWVSWASWVKTGSFKQRPTTVLESAVVRWSVDDYVSNTDLCIELAELIGNAGPQAEEVFREAYPYLIEFFVERPGQPVRVFIPLYSTLIKVAGWTGALSGDELELTSSLIQALMSVGPTKAVYVDCLQDLGEIVAANSSPVHLDWALNTAEMLALYPAQDKEVRLRFFTSVIGMAQSAFHRMTGVQRSVLEVLANDYECPDLLDLLPATQSSELLEPAANTYAKLIGIYTLTESAGQRAKQLLQKLLPRARVELNG